MSPLPDSGDSLVVLQATLRPEAIATKRMMSDVFT
jgi:hypothetical protein